MADRVSANASQHRRWFSMILKCNAATQSSPRTLAVLSVVYLEVRAFGRDAAALSRATTDGWTVSAMPEEGGDSLAGLKFAHVKNRVDADSRTLIFHVFLPNSILHVTGGHERAYPTWQFKPGQQMRVRLPVEHWENKIDLPAEAIAEQGPDRFVFAENGPRRR